MKISKPASRIFALLLAVFMVFGMLPVSAFAAGETVTYKQVTTIEAGKEYILAVRSSDSGSNSSSAYAVTATTDSDNQKQKTKVNFTGNIDNNNATVALASGNDYSKVLWKATAVEGGIKLTNGSLAIGRSANGKGLVISSNNTDSTLFVHTVENGKIVNTDGSTKHYIGYGNVGTTNYAFGFAQSNTSSFTDKIRIFTAEDTSGGEGGGNINPPSQSENLTKVDTLTDGKYIIVSEGMALDLDVAETYTRSSGGKSYKYDGFNGKAVTVSGNKITGDVYKDMVWEVKAVSGGYSIKSTYATGSDVYLTGSYVNNYGLLELDSEAAVWTYSDSKLTTGGKSIANDDNSFDFFTMRSTGSNVSFYAVTDESAFKAPTYGSDEGGDDDNVDTNVSFVKATAVQSGKQYLIVAASSSGSYYALTNGTNLKTAVDVSGDIVTLRDDTNETALLWTVGTAAGEQTTGGNLTFSNGSTLLGRSSSSVSLKDSDNSSRYFGLSYHESGTLTNISTGGSTTSTYYLGYGSSGNNWGGGGSSDFRFATTNDNNITLYEKVSSGGSGNQGGNEGGGTVTPPVVTPTDDVYLAFTSDIHNNGSATTNGTGANNLTKWLEAVAKKNNDTFDTMGFTGDHGSRSANGDGYWNYVQTVMDVVSSSDYVDATEGFFVDGNHEYQNGQQNKNHTNSNATSKKIKLIGEKLVAEDYVLYSFGASGSSEHSGFVQTDIDALDAYLKTVDGQKPVFVLSHFPIHYYNNRTTGNAQALVTVLNKYPNVIFLWGHNHTLSDSYYDEVYEAGSELPLTSSNSSKVKINFTYAAAGCMADSSTAAGVQADGLVAKIDGNKVTLTYYGLSANVVGQSTTITIKAKEPEHQCSFNGAPYVSANGQHWQVCTDDTCDKTSTKVDCSGGTATCQAKAVCTTCGNAYGEKSNTHKWAETYTQENNQHFHKCTVEGCTATDTKTNCSGGEATCVAKAVCSTCNKAYGEVSATHNLASTYEKDAEKHWQKCTVTGCDHTTEKVNHTYVEGECSVCDAEEPAHPHTWAESYTQESDKHFKKCTVSGCTATTEKTDCSGGTATCQAKAVCSTCNKAYGAVSETHAWAETYTQESDKHFKKCTVSGCTATTEKTDCSGGTATCQAKAVCTTCNKEYGEKSATHAWAETYTQENDQHFHKCTVSGCTATDTKTDCAGGTATCQAKAVCSTCNKAYGEVSATHNLASTYEKDAEKHWQKCTVTGCDHTTEKVNHTYVEGECSVCDAEDPDYVPEAPATKKYLIVSNGYAMTSNEGEGYQNTGSNSSQKYNYTGLAGVEYNANSRAAVTEDMLWTIEEVSGGYRIKQGDKILNASYGSNSTGGNDGKLMLSNTDDTWSRSGNLLKSKNADKFLTVGNPTSTNTSQTLFTVRSESNAKAVEFIEYSGSTPEPQPKTLQSIAVTTNPTKMTYTAGEDFASAGMVVTATYSDNTKAAVTGYTISGGDDMTAGTKTITISYTEGGETKTTTLNVTVNAVQTPDDDEPSYTKVNASDIKVNDKIIIVGKNGNNYYALTNGSDQTTDVTVANNELTITGSASALIWTVGEATGNQVDTANGNDLDFVFSNGSTYFGRVTDTNVVEFATGSAANTKYFGHDIASSTIGNYSRGGAYYGLLYQNNQFIYVENANNSNASVLFFKAYNVVDDDDNQGGNEGGNQGGNEGGNQGGNEGGEVTDEPTKVTTLKAGQYVIANGSNALTSKVHSGYTNSSSYKYSGFEGKKVTISGNKITDATADMVFELASSGSGYTIKHISSGKYLNATYTQNSNNSGWTGTLKLDNTADVWTWDAGTGYLKSTNASNKDGSKGLYLVFDDVNNNVQSGNQTNLFGIRSDSNSGNNLDKIDFYLVGKALEDDDDNQGGNQGGTVTPAPEGTTFVAFSSDVHSQTTSTTSGSPARLNTWLNNVSGVVGGTFDTMAFCGDNADGTGNANGNAYWDRVEAVMSVVTNSSKVNGDGIFINGNHEWSNGQVGSSTHATAKKIKNIGHTVNEEDYAIYVFGAASSNQSYNTSDITALGNWLKTAPTNKPIFIISHFPIHSAAGRTTTNADTLRTTLNEYADDHDIYFLWGHNHTNANNGENHYDKVYTGTLDNQTIGFTYLAAGCMSGNEYSGGSNAVAGKGLVAKIVDGKVETLTYYGESGNVVLEYKVENTPADPDPDQPVDPDQPDEPIVPDEPGKVTTLEDGYYIIVSNNNTKALTNTANSGYSNSNGYSYTGFNGADVTISGDKITNGATESMVFEIKAVTGGYTIKNVEKNQYLTATYTQASSGSGYDGKLFLSDTAEVWELDSNFRLKSTNASQNGRNLGLYLTYDDKADSLSSGAANFFGIRSEGESHDFANVDKIDFYKVEVKEEPEPEQPEHKHTWGEATYTFAADGKSCTATRACTEDATHTESATATITSAVKTAATCETMGTTTYTATFTEEWAETQTKDVQDIPVIAHVFENGECTNCGTEDPAEADLFELYAASMNLGNSLAMNFFIEIEDLEFGEDYYAVITKNYADGREDLKITVQDEDWQEYNSELLRITINKIAAKEMSDCVTVVIFNDEGEQVSKTWVDSVRDYTMRGVHKEMAKADPNEELMAVYVELLNYGAAAQEVFDYNVDDLANNELTEAHQAYGLNNVQMEDFRVSEGAFAGTSLSLESNILMNFYFNIDPADYEGLKAVATYTDHYGHDHEVTFDGDDFSKYNSTIWGVSLETLVVADCREFVTVKVYEADGDLLASVTDSMEGYAARRGANDTMSISIMTFAVAAYNYFH